VERDAAGGPPLRTIVLLALAVAAGSLSAAGPAATSANTLTLTHTGLTPHALSISAGETVTFVNADAEANLHELVVSPPTGFVCDAPVGVLPTHEAAGFDIVRGGSSTCRFGVARPYSLRDYNFTTPAFRARLRVRADPAAQRLSVAAVPTTVRYGGRALLTGRVAGVDNVDVYEFACSAGPPPKIANVSAAADGTFRLSVQPLRNTTYEARAGTSYIAEAAVAVHPLVALTKIGRGRYEVRVTAKDASSTKIVLLQRRSARRWSTVQRAPLKRITTSESPIYTSSVSIARFETRLRHGTRLRAYLPASRGSICYAAAVSPSIAG
jgi:hypothetical protein